MIIDMFGNKRFKIGLHIHTTESDGRKTREECAAIYKAAGFDAIAFTDHWKFGEETEINGLKIISGCEYENGEDDTSVGVMHIVGLGMKKNPEIDVKASRQETVDGIRRAGGLAVLAHPAWSLNTLKDITELSGIEAIEIYNTVSGVEQSFRAYSGYFVDALANTGAIYPLTATDDAHYYNGSDETKSFIMVKCDELTTENVLNAVRNYDFYATQGPELHTRVENGKVIIKCSPCTEIRAISNMGWCSGRVVRGENMTEYSYTIKNLDKWVRVEVVDEYGRTAWGNIHII